MFTVTPICVTPICYKRIGRPRRLIAGFALVIGLVGVAHAGNAQAASTECRIVNLEPVKGTCVGWHVKKTKGSITAISPDGGSVVSQQLSGGGGDSTGAALGDLLGTLL